MAPAAPSRSLVSPIASLFLDPVFGRDVPPDGRKGKQCWMPSAPASHVDMAGQRHAYIHNLIDR